MHARIFANPRCLGKRSRHSQRMRNPQFYASGKRPMADYISVHFHLCFATHWGIAHDIDDRSYSSALAMKLPQPCTKPPIYKSCRFETVLGCIIYISPFFVISIFGWWLRPPTIYDETGAAACNIHCYTVIGFWWWGGSVADNAYWTLLAIVCHRIFIIILVEYRLGLLGIQMYHGFKRLLNHTDISVAHL